MNGMLAPPPRRVPLSLRVANLCNGVALAGWLVTGFGSVFLWVFAAQADFSFFNFRGETATATGRVTSSQWTRARENKVPIAAIHYEYPVDGALYRGVSYARGFSRRSGERVEVQYLSGDPARSRIAGMRRAPFSPWVAMVAVIPLIGVVLLAAGTLWGARRNGLLRDGISGWGTLRDKNPTEFSVNRRRVWELRFDFTSRDGLRGSALARTHEPARLEDEVREPLLYDPRDPSRAFLLDELPSRPRLDGSGEWTGRPLALGRLLIPALVLGGNLVFAYISLS